jgi:hypothetical protein
MCSGRVIHAPVKQFNLTGAYEFASTVQLVICFLELDVD